MTRIFITVFVSICLASCSSKEQTFKIDNSISKNIDSIFKANILFDSPIKPEFSFHVVNTFDYKKFGKNGMDLAYFLEADSYNSTDVYVSSITQCNLSKDTIVLVGGLFYGSGIGFRITLFNDKYDYQFYLVSTDKIYSPTGNKSDLAKEIFLNSDSSSMTLTQKPNLKIGSVVKGSMKIKPHPFYQLDSSNFLIKINPEFDIIFDTKISEMEKD